MKRNEITRTGNIKFKLFFNILMFCIILPLALNSHNQNQPSKQTILEAEPKVLAPGECEIIGVVDDKGYDYNDSRGYEYLEVDVKVNVGENGDYVFHAYLSSKDDKPIGMGHLLLGCGIDITFPAYSTKLKEGINTVPIYFFGSSIREKKTNGPYKVSVIMFEMNSNASSNEVDFYTSRYMYRQFSKANDDD